MIKNLVFSGGGTKLYTFIGFLKALHEAKMVNNIESIIGTSAGSFIALLICLNYHYNEIEKLLLKINLDKFNNLKVGDILNFFQNYGIENGDKFIDILKVIIKAKTGSDICSFKKLKELTNKNLIITSTCLNTLSCEYFNYESHPEMNIIDAIIMSVSIPFFFKPFIFENKYYVDGSLLNHYPIKYFEHSKKNTIGILVTENLTNSKIENFYDYLYIVFSCPYLFNIKNCYESYQENTILIESNENFLNFNIEYNTKINLIDNSYIKTKEYLISNTFI